MNDLTMMPITEVSSLIRQRRVSPLEVVEEAIAGNAYCHNFKLHTAC